MAAVQITLYAGGIVVLIIFSILLTSQISHKFERIEAKKAFFSALAAIAGAVVVITTILNTHSLLTRLPRQRLTCMSSGEAF
jgi:NADH-quinone oxidoreductase subunit J